MPVCVSSVAAWVVSGSDKGACEVGASVEKSYRRPVDVQ